MMEQIAANIALEMAASGTGYIACKALHLAALSEYDDYVREVGRDSIDAPQQFGEYRGGYLDIFTQCLEVTIQGLELFLSRGHQFDVSRYESRLNELRVLQSTIK